MEEDIKILEERYKKAIDCINNTNLPLFVEDTVEDIFNRLEQLEKENKELKESHDYIHEAYQDAGKKMFYYQEQLDDSIPKSVIRDKIEEFKRLSAEISGYNYECIPKDLKRNDYAVKMLEQLLKEE